MTILFLLVNQLIWCYLLCFGWSNLAYVYRLVFYCNSYACLKMAHLCELVYSQCFQQFISTTKDNSCVTDFLKTILRILEDIVALGLKVWKIKNDISFCSLLTNKTWSTFTNKAIQFVYTWCSILTWLRGTIINCVLAPLSCVAWFTGTSEIIYAILTLSIILTWWTSTIIYIHITSHTCTETRYIRLQMNFHK